MIKKVLFITNVYPNKKESFRGVYIQNRAKELQLKSIDTRVCFLSRDKRETNDLFSKNYLFKHKKSKLNYFHIGPKPEIEKEMFSDIQLFNPDIIIFCVVSLWLKKVIMKKLSKFKFANFFEGRNGDGQFKNHYFYNLLIKRHEINLFKKMDYLLFCSPLAEQDFVKKFPMIDTKKCCTLLNGFDKNIFTPITKHTFSTDTIRIISVGNIEPAKGQLLLSKSIAESFKTTEKEIIFELIGTGTKDKIDEIKRTLSGKNIKFIYKEMLTQNELKNELLDFDYFVLPSYFESFGCVYLEAMSQGLITVGCKNQGPSIFIKDGYNGFLIEENSIEKLNSFFNEVLNANINIESISYNAIETSKKWGWDNFGEKFTTLFNILF